MPPAAPSPRPAISPALRLPVVYVAADLRHVVLLDSVALALGAVPPSLWLALGQPPASAAGFLLTPAMWGRLRAKLEALRARVESGQSPPDRLAEAELLLVPILALLHQAYTSEEIRHGEANPLAGPLPQPPDCPKPAFHHVERAVASCGWIDLSAAKR